MMMLFRWLSTVFSPARRRPIRVRLNVERLEDRLTPTAGLLDPTFGAGAGYVLAPFSNVDGVNAVAVQSNGQIVTADVIGVARYNADGSVDTSFGTGGLAAPNSKSFNDGGSVVAIQSDGKILTGGFGRTNHGVDYSYLARYNANGTVDTTFGSNGEVVIPQAGLTSIAVQTDGKILVGGGTTLARYNANGTLDTTFGNGGELTNLPFHGVANTLIQPDGKIVLAGIVNDPVGNMRAIGVARFNTDGTIDTSFGNGGEVITDVGIGVGAIGRVALQADGKIVVSGIASITSGPGEPCLVRYNADGTLDTTFGSSGTGIDIVPLPAGYSEVAAATSIGVQSDGKIVVAVQPGAPGVWGAVRVNADGSLDTSYGNDGGWATVQIGYRSNELASALQPDGRLLLAGAERPTQSSTPNYATLIRLTTDPTPTAASTLRVTGFPTLNNAGIAGSFTVTALDANGNRATGYTGTVHFTSSDPNALLPADYTFTADDNGAHTFTATLNTAGTQSLTATDTATASITGSQSGITVTPASLPATTLSVSGFPATTTAGVAATLTVTAEDANGNVASGYRGTVQFSSSDQQAGLPASYTFTAADQGVHTFSVTLKTAGSQSLTATDTATGSISGSESGIVVQPAAASQLVLSAPSSVSHGVAFSVTVTALDPYGNVATGYLGTIHFSSSDSNAKLPPNYTFTASDGGVHTFTGQFILSKKGTKTLTVTDTQNSALTATDSINAV
ncbi:MAG TPA: hypothetical protein VH682_12345 [Gemmataceae bacterium]|jgi:uncharacterized delta-60 repeat protein